MNRALVYSWYEQYKTGIYRFCLSILKDPHGAEDVLQETFLRLLSGKYVVQEEKIQAWLYRVARNCCYDTLRKREREQELPPELPSQDGQYAYIERLSVLDLSDREIVTMKVLSGMTCREIGKVMGMTGPAVQKRYERAIKNSRNRRRTMENKLKMDLEALPEPETTFEALEAMYAQPKPVRRRKRTVILIAAVLALLLCGMGWAKSRYGMWLLYDSYSWEDLESQAKKHDIVLPGELDGIPFLQMQVYGHVPQGGSLAQAMLNPLYKPVCVDYGFRIRDVSPDGKTESQYDQDVFGLNFGTTKNELWRYFFGIDENGKWTSWNVPGSYQTIEYKGTTLQVGDTVWHYESDGRTVYTRWVHWVDEERKVAFSLNETDYTDPNRVVDCAKAIIDLNS